MTELLVVGMPGSGKTTLVNELVNRGAPAFDADDIPGIWRTSQTNNPKDAELIGGNYTWDLGVMKDFLSSHSGPLIVAGIAHNFPEAIGLFSQTAFLDVSQRALQRRLASPSRINPLGKTEASAAALFEFLPSFYKAVGELAIHSIDAERSIPEIADTIFESYL